MNVETIIATLEQQADVYSQLLTLAKEKTPYLVHNQVEQLNAAIQKERKLVKIAEDLEQQRMRLCGQYFTNLGLLRYKGGKISEMIRTVTSHQDKKLLTDLHTTLTSLLEDLQVTSKLNQQLIEQSLKFIDYSIDLMVDDPNSDVVYQHPHSPGYGNNMRTGLFNTRG
ncbi:flagellar protein FlgN [Paenibacillus sp. OV219]|uniref:flagellar protein FlgN n=1 Tax=Paenibacillus sp. OV219 TaxID=1884377 RepID=UPI0008AD9435|nr:flagellar protein FlgN [Paenibacillus sp. OV219]SEN64545.1 FlgN protein [Paenibacillus sp. OV219]